MFFTFSMSNSINASVRILIRIEQAVVSLTDSTDLPAGTRPPHEQPRRSLH